MSEGRVGAGDPGFYPGVIALKLGLGLVTTFYRFRFHLGLGGILVLVSDWADCGFLISPTQTQLTL